MSHFWAKFEQHGVNLFRYDTRIYLNSISTPSDSDICIGAIVGKNPGSAIAINCSHAELQPINLDGDKLLPTVRNIILKAYAHASIKVPNRKYVQVLNLFYLCNPDLGQAINLIKEHSSSIKNCKSELKEFPWVWYVWGGENQNLSEFKLRFSQLTAEKNFYFDKVAGSIVKTVPSVKAFAKHTQGLKHDFVVPYIAELVKNN